MNEVQMQQKLEEYFNTHEDTNRTYEDFLQYYVSEGAVLDIEMEVSPSNDVKCTVNTKGCRRRKMMPHLFGR